MVNPFFNSIHIYANWPMPKKHAANTMTPAQRKAKQVLDKISGVKETISWLDRSFFDREDYVMPGTSLPAYRYTYITNEGQRETKEIAIKFERAAREAGFPIRATAHLTRKLDGSSYYWKVEAFFPVHSFKDKT